MATSRDLVEVMADALVLPTESVNSVYRVLREAGLVTKAGRGRGAAHMTSEDVAKLLIALMAGESLQDIPAACTLLSESKSFEAMGAGKEVKIVERMTLLEATTIVLSQVQPRADRRQRERRELPLLGDVSREFVELEIWPTHLEARISVQDSWLDFGAFAEEVKPISPDRWYSLPPRERLIQRSEIIGLHTKRIVGREALMRIAHIFREET